MSVETRGGWNQVGTSLGKLFTLTILPVVLQRQQLANALARYLGQLGLKRRAKPVADLQTYLAQKYREADQPKQGHQAAQDGQGPQKADPAEPEVEGNT